MYRTVVEEWNQWITRTIRQCYLKDWLEVCLSRVAFILPYANAIPFFCRSEASEAKGWNGYFRLKNELHLISSFDPIISKLYRQDIRFNNGAQFERARENFEETLSGRERRAAGKDETGNVGAFYDVSQTDLQALPRKFKLYMVGNADNLATEISLTIETEAEFKCKDDQHCHLKICSFFLKDTTRQQMGEERWGFDCKNCDF